MFASFEAAEALLRRHYGHGSFRAPQARVIQSVLAGLDVLAVLPTGGGKSVCFQVPALASGGLCLVVSPLISLMQDQVGGARSRGIGAAAFHSALSSDEAATALREAAAGRLTLLYTSPERLPRLGRELLAAGARIALLAVDEAHCISEWGHDFRTEFRAIGATREALGSPQTIALTGSATPKVRDDIARVLGLGRGRAAGAAVHVASFDRRNLRFEACRVTTERERFRVLLGLLVRGETAIVYAPTRRSTETLALALRHAGHRAAPYHAGLDTGTRAEVLDDFLEDRLGVVVATSAFGMGIDKPGVRRVVHWSMPPTPESYYQEAGRAGRDGAHARCVLLVRRGDATLHRRQLDVTFPERRLLESLWSGRTDPARVPANVRESAERLRAELRSDGGAPDWSRVVQRRRAAERRIDTMWRYASGRRCRRAALLGYFGERLRACAGCDRCRN
ncbi:MAG TPA: RecQ family ATP-dependent DNA helicase [Gemmatimonadales bacterium]|jgi:ATP-dependent DNA helicase RecQ|nr:RecQ family ATP-dependent DNA helicase [Gemmatimonadales bacterium]